MLFCDEGYASSLAAATLHKLGLTRATDLDGGYQAWRRWRERAAPVTPGARARSGPAGRESPASP